MLRLRTTTGLSALALAVGIAGTGWLSGLTGQWPDAPGRVATSRVASRAPQPAKPLHRRPAAAYVVQSRRVPQEAGDDTAQAAAIDPPTTLQPIATPGDSSQTWEQLRGHLDGRVVVHLRINASGRVDRASLAASSGDPILDAHALRSVRGWRFAVPPDHPDGLSGELPMQFSSQRRAMGML